MRVHNLDEQDICNQLKEHKGTVLPQPWNQHWNTYGSVSILSPNLDHLALPFPTPTNDGTKKSIHDIETIMPGARYITYLWLGSSKFVPYNLSLELDITLLIVL